MKKIVISAFILAAMWAGSVQAAEGSQSRTNAAKDNTPEVQAKSLEELLQMVKEGKVVNREINQRREREFLAQKAQQQQKVKDAKEQQRQEEARSDRLETQFENNEQEIAGLQDILSKRLGSLRELFGVLQEVSSDLQGTVEGSVISAEYPGRGQWLGDFAKSMGKSSKLAKISEMEHLWYELQRQMTESGKVSRFKANVIKVNGEQQEQEVTRVGTFNVVSDGKYLKYDVQEQVLTELPRQPAGRFVDTAEALTQTQPGSGGFVQFGLDPTRGQLLSLLIQTPTIEERIQQGGNVGYVIIALGVIALLLSIERLITLNIVGAKVNAQLKNPTPDQGNPLGRVLQIYHDNKDVDAETLQLKLDEAILKEQPKINARIAFIKIISMVAPLLGLLGTVVGMILTFQAITLFGTGDPKTMAGGISQALMTTVMGLCVAIPTVLLHSIVYSRSTTIMHILSEQSAGLIAEHAEAESGGQGS